jgi:hypothetical protein
VGEVGGAFKCHICPPHPHCPTAGNYWASGELDSGALAAIKHRPSLTALTVLHSTIHAQQSTVNAQQSTFNAQQSTVNEHLSTVNAHQSTVNAHQSTANGQQSTVNSHQSTVDAQQSTETQSTTNGQQKVNSEPLNGQQDAQSTVNAQQEAQPSLTALTVLHSTINTHLQPSIDAQQSTVNPPREAQSTVNPPPWASVRVALTPVTGRRHQLRLHARYIGGVIRGDVSYGAPLASRLFLHSKVLAVEGVGRWEAQEDWQP